ncbi:MAG: HAMP domain-containing sensor histidine kinase [Cyanobacteria bacterium P01_D01_bin.14]
MVQLLDHIRSVLVSLLSYEFQTPLSTIQVAVETLADGDTMPAQAQRSVLDLALAELKQLCEAVEGFLAYANQLWSNTLDFVQCRSDPATSAYLDSIFTALPEVLAGYQPWMAAARQRLMPFLAEMESGVNVTADPVAPEQIWLVDQAKRDVLAIVNHELRTPLTTLQVCLETLQVEEEPHMEDRQALLSIASGDLKRLCVLVQDLELLCRLETGQICFKTEPVDLRATLQATLSSVLRQTSDEGAANVWVESAAQLSSVWADGDRLMDVLKRLLENACRFTAPTGEVKVNAQITRVTAGKSDGKPAEAAATLKICVADTGRGISADQLVRVFDCFHQEEGYLQRTTGGMGIGLTICRHLIEGMGGQIWAESAGKQQGSRFCFMLPVHRQAEEWVR